MTRDDDLSESLEVIDLDSESETSTRASRPWKLSRSWGAVVMGGAVAAILVSFVVATHEHTHHQAGSSGAHPPTTTGPTSAFVNTLPNRTSTSIKLPSVPIVGRLYPDLDRRDIATFVLPSGRAVTLSGGLPNLIGGLGATFGGSVSKQLAQACCPGSPVSPFDITVNFEVFHAAPNDLFTTHTTGAVTTPLLLSPAQAKAGVDGLQGGEYRFAMLSTGDWTLIAFLLDYHTIVDTGLLRGWHLRSTPNGAVLSLPADSTISSESITLGRTPDLTDREITLTENGCPTNSTKARTLNQSATHGSWCQHGLLVGIEGPESYVGVAVADLKVGVIM